ncbi:MAG: hypothetical protein QXL15_03770 [Candidatus Korarchaeota archaeon]
MSGEKKSRNKVRKTEQGTAIPTEVPSSAEQISAEKISAPLSCESNLSGKIPPGKKQDSYGYILYSTN